MQSIYFAKYCPANHPILSAAREIDFSGQNSWALRKAREATKK